MITINNAEASRLLEGIKFASVTYRLFKLPADALEDSQEDYGQSVSYKGACVDVLGFSHMAHGSVVHT